MAFEFVASMSEIIAIGENPFPYSSFLPVELSCFVLFSIISRFSDVEVFSRELNNDSVK